MSALELMKAIRNGPPKCLVCDSEILGAKPGVGKDKDMRWCEPCQSFQKVYRGTPRKPLCVSCFNCVGISHRQPYQPKPRYACAALMYQMPDGTWRDRYNTENRSYMRNSGMDKVIEPIKPNMMAATHSCECYEFIGEGETRDSIERNDPLRFYDRSRFFD